MYLESNYRIVTHTSGNRSNEGFGAISPEKLEDRYKLPSQGINLQIFCIRGLAAIEVRMTFDAHQRSLE